MATWDTFIDKDFKDMVEDEEHVAVIRDLTPGRGKYRSTYARVKFSKDAGKYPEKLRVRLGRGQLVETPCSMEILEFVSVIPKGL
ncbi:MAG: phenylphosphate carboxylase subunit gamma [Syntrophorhabdales bacterium]